MALGGPGRGGRWLLLLLLLVLAAATALAGGARGQALAGEPEEGEEEDDETLGSTSNPADADGAAPALDLEDVLPRLVTLREEEERQEFPADPADTGKAACRRRADCPPRHLCLKGKRKAAGTCTCPVLFEGPRCDQPKPARAKWCLEPFRSDWRRYGVKSDKDFTTCAVVGSSDSLKKKNRGAEIDAHTAVFRFNEVPGGGRHSKYAGKQHSNTVRFQNRQRGGFAQQRGELCVIWRNNYYKRKRSGKGCQMQMLSGKMVGYAGSYFKRNRGGPGRRPKSRQQAKMSNGFLGVVVALHMCARVDMYGFSQGKKHYYNKFQGRPRGWGSRDHRIGTNKRPLNERHSWRKERACTNILAKAHRGKFNIYN